MSERRPRSGIRTLVVGGGGAGAPLAARLAADPRRSVTLVEAGATDAQTWQELQDGGTLRGAVPGHAANWSYPAELAPGRPYVVARGRILGGSTAINGGYFVRATPADFARWAEAGGSAWSYPQALPLLRELENDLDHRVGAARGVALHGAELHGAELRGAELHGSAGPMRVSRPPQTNAVAAAFTEGARELGFPLEPDKNAGGEPGVGPVPSNIVDGVRVSSAAAYLPAVGERVRVLGGTRALRVVWDRAVGPGAVPRAVGVETSAGFLEADEVVLAAGSIATPQLLMLSGIGPRAHLAAHGIPVLADLPVGEAFADHPNLAIPWLATRSVVDWNAGYGFPTALNFDASRVDASLEPRAEGDIEILLASKPLEYLLTGVRPAAPVHEFLVALQEHTGRGTLTLNSADPLLPPRIEYHYLERPEDRQRMRVAVRTAARILRTRAFAGLFAGFAEPDGSAGEALSEAVLGDDDRLDAWVLDHLGTALHTCATAPMGSVVDGAGRVRGVHGLRVADTSILPTAPHRGPSNTAVFIGERIARSMLEEAGVAAGAGV